MVGNIGFNIFFRPHFFWLTSVFLFFVPVFITLLVVFHHLLVHIVVSKAGHGLDEWHLIIRIAIVVLGVGNAVGVGVGIVEVIGIVIQVRMWRVTVRIRHHVWQHCVRIFITYFLQISK